jgi:hypothetical protein
MERTELIAIDPQAGEFHAAGGFFELGAGTSMAARKTFE